MLGSERFGRMLWLLAGLGCSATQHDAQRAGPAPAAYVELAPVDAREPQKKVVASAPETADAGLLEAPVAADPQHVSDLLASFPPASHSTSIGSATNGRLAGGVALPASGPGFRFNSRRSEDARFATVETVRAIVRAAGVVARERPGSELIVNDLGLEAGGRIAHHGSHRAGRDADLLFFMLGDDGQPLPAVGAPLDPEGIGFDYKDLSIADDDVRVRLDVSRTWRFVRALLDDPEAPVQRVFIAEHLRARLLAEAERESAPSELIARFAEVTCQPSYPHDDHFHVRWFCSAEDSRAGCEDLPPMYPWRAAELERAGVAPVLAKKGRSEDPAPVVTKADAEREVMRQEPHPDVLAFLKRRRAWEKQPHPGRPYCP